MAGRNFLFVPGPTNVPDRVLRAMVVAMEDHRSSKFPELTRTLFPDLKKLFNATDGQVFIFPSTGTGAWEASLVNTLSPGDRVLMFETGHFAALWRGIADRLELRIDLVPGDWRHGVDPAVVEQKLTADPQHAIKAVCAVHNETSTGVASRIPEVRAAIDRARHPALFFVDTISSLGSIDYRHDEWKVDVTVGGSQKGLMLPPGLSFNAISPKALAAAKTAKLRRSYWDWEPMLQANENGFFPYTPATNLLYGLRESLHMLAEEGLPNVFARHHRLAEATRRAVRGWGLELNAVDEREHSDSLTGIRLPEGHDADRLRGIILERFDLSLGQGLGKLKGRLFRIGHLGWFNDLMLAGTLSGVEMGLKLARIPCSAGGVAAALDYLSSTAT
jgi:alanine-glyoxylate transaminase/serine-glyoxylate transaminase/serine-pyruvate transaminase